MKGCEGHLGQAKFDQIIKEVYGDISSSCSETDSKSLSSGYVGILMEITGSFLDKEVMSYDCSIIDNNDISKLQSNKQISSTGNEEDVVLEPFVVGERVCITRSRGVSDKYYYFYLEVIQDFKIHIHFTNFESDLLKTLNIAPSQFRPNDRGFIKDFELVYEAMNIISTLGLFFSFFELKGMDKGGWVSLSGIPGKRLLQAYTMNYKGFKDKFIWVKSGKRCPKVMYALDGAHRFPIY